MKIAILCAVILSAAVARAETIIIEYPDHYYVESVGTPEVKSAHSPGSSVPPAAKTTPATANESSAPPATAKPMTNFDSTPQPVEPAARRASMDKEIQRLQRERSELMKPQEGETPDQANRRQQAAAGKLRKINKMSSELLKIPVQGNEQSN